MLDRRAKGARHARKSLERWRFELLEGTWQLFSLFFGLQKEQACGS